MRLMFCLLLLPLVLIAQSTGDSTRIQHPLPAGSDFWIAKDKADHLVASAFLVGLGYYAHNREWHQSQAASRRNAVLFSLSFGLAKEAYDQYYRKSKASWKDLLADAAGCLLGYAALRAGYGHNSR